VQFILIVGGLILIGIAVYLWREAKETPEDELIDKGMGEYWSHERQQLSVIIGLCAGAIAIIAGAIL